jgi:hypothetical protein
LGWGKRNLAVYGEKMLSGKYRIAHSITVQNQTLAFKAEVKLSRNYSQ